MASVLGLYLLSCAFHVSHLGYMDTSRLLYSSGFSQPLS